MSIAMKLQSQKEMAEIRFERWQKSRNDHEKRWAGEEWRKTSLKMKRPNNRESRVFNISLTQNLKSLRIVMGIIFGRKKVNRLVDNMII